MLGLSVFIVCGLALVGGYFLYGRFAQRVYGLDSRFKMPCVSKADGVDFVPLPTWKVFLIQLLNIAGLGPVVGAVCGCLFGPISLIWIVCGCVFAGALHDFFAAMMSAEQGGNSLPDVLGTVMGRSARIFMNIICVFLLLMVGVVFTLLPSGMLAALFPSLAWSPLIWSGIILSYYFLATVLPIQAIIGRIYPLFGVLFLFMAVSMTVSLPLNGLQILPELNFLRNYHPNGVGVWPMIFVTIACGAISGFHATQSPMMVRCLKDARHLRRVFYGAMIVEGLVALVWAVVGLSLRDVLFSVEGESVSFASLSLQNPAMAVNVACRELLGNGGAVAAVLGVIVLAVTSGDTAMRSCRLMLADLFQLPQRSKLSRLGLSIPLFAAVVVISQLDFSVIWRYFGWANQTLACLTLWCITLHLYRKRKNYWLTVPPTMLMTVVCVSYLLNAPECGIGVDVCISTTIGLVISASMLCLLLVGRKNS